MSEQSTNSSMRPGRPKKKTPVTRLQITLPPTIFDLLESQRGNVPRSTYIQGLIYGRAVMGVGMDFIANGVVRGPIDERTDDVCLTAIGKTAYSHLGMPPHKPMNQDLQCRCVILPNEGQNE